MRTILKFKVQLLQNWNLEEAVMFTPTQGTRMSTRASTLSERRSKVENVSRTPRTEVLNAGENYVMKSLDSPLPVHVQEALRADIRVTSVKLHESGWAWLVAGSKMLLWRFSTNQLTTKCYHVSLLSSTVGWKADLVDITSGSAESEVSLFGCSPEGVICWWCDVLKNSACMPALHASLDVGEGSVYSVTRLPFKDCPGYLVASSLSNLWVVCVQKSQQTSELELSVRPLALPHSVFSGIGRRMSSLFFGSQTLEVQELRSVVVSHNDQVETVGYVLTNSHLQRWRITRLTEELLFNGNVVSLLSDVVGVAGWVDESMEPSVLVIDMQVCKGHVVLLFAVSSTSLTEYGIAVHPASSDPSPSNIKQLIRLNCPVPAESTSLLTAFSLHGINTSSSVLIISKNTVLLAEVMEGSLDTVVSASQQNMVLGIGQFSHELLVFTLLHGVVSIVHSAKSHTSSIKISSTRKNVSMLTTPTSKPRSFAPNFSFLAEESIAESAHILESAFFQLYLEGDIAGAISLCDEHFSQASFSQGLNTHGDYAVSHLSQLILDDPPPQVDSSFGDGQSESQRQQKSMIVIYHLQQKMDAHTRYIEFLGAVGLLGRVSCVTHHGCPIPTNKLLCQHGELLQAAITLRKIHNSIADGVINRVVNTRPRPTSSPPLSRNDIFYTSVSMFEEFFSALVPHQREALNLLKGAQDKVTLLLSASTLLDSMLKSALFYRQAKSGVYEDPDLSENVVHGYLPWTASKEMRTCLTEQLNMLFNIGVAGTQGDQDVHSLWSTIVSLVDILLDGYKVQLESSRSKQDEVRRSYHAQRKKYLNLLLDSGRLSAVTELAEKYEDFEMLVTLCHGTGSTTKLKEYMMRFSEQGFSDFLFKQYLDDGQLKQLLSFSGDFPAELGAFLEQHLSLKWLHCLATQDYTNAQLTLKQLADQEMKCIGRKKTYLSLSKLSLLASRPTEETKAEQLDVINTHLQHILVQQELPPAVVEAAGMDYAFMPSLSPLKIIEMYVGELNPDSSEKQFLIALDYLQFASPSLEKQTVESMATYIWSRAILKDDWTQLSTDDVLAELRKTFFSRVWRGCLQQGWNLLQILPELKSLLMCPALVETGLHQDHTFQYLVRAAYEQISREQELKTTNQVA